MSTVGADCTALLHGRVFGKRTLAAVLLKGAILLFGQACGAFAVRGPTGRDFARVFEPIFLEHGALRSARPHAGRRTIVLARVEGTLE